jgi:hypothetical protein
LLPDEGTTMPGLGTRDICTGCRSGTAGAHRDGLDYGCVATFLGRDGLRIDLASVFVPVDRFGCGDRRQNEAGPEGLR